MPLINASTIGQRQVSTSNTSQTLEVATARVVERLERDSYFFDQNPPPPLPRFELSEVELRDELGKGEFGVVLEVSALHVVEDCPCSKCLQSRDNKDKDEQEQEEHPTTRQQEQQQPTKYVMEGMPSSTSPSSRALLLSSSSSRDTQHKLIAQEQDSTVSTYHDFDDDELSLASTINQDNNNNNEQQQDGEIEFVKGYMSQHCFRAGVPRYAVKRLRPEFLLEQSPAIQLQAAMDLVGEAKFMASLHHPNICKMRGTIGQPGSFEFMIVMDCLKMTLREKMTQWKEELSNPSSRNNNNKGGMFAFLKHRGSHQQQKKALEDDVFADKLLALYDIARAMRYLHNHQILFRDLKPENVAFDLRGDMRLFDFGLAKELKQKDLVEAPDGFNATGLTGSRRYMAPEVILCKNYGLSADVYSYAILVWEVFSDRTPFPNMSCDKHFEHVVLKHKRPKTIKSLPKEMHNMIDDAWSHERSERPNFKSICEKLASQIVVLNCISAHSISDRTAQLMNRSLRSRLESNDSVVVNH